MSPVKFRAFLHIYLWGIAVHLPPFWRHRRDTPVLEGETRDQLTLSPCGIRRQKKISKS